MKRNFLDVIKEVERKEEEQMRMKRDGNPMEGFVRNFNSKDESILHFFSVYYLNLIHRNLQLEFMLKAKVNLVHLKESKCLL